MALGACFSAMEIIPLTLLALGVLVFCLREMQSDRVWERTARLVKVGFRGLNVGLGLMVLLDLFPADLTFILVGVAPMVLAAFRSYARRDAAHDAA